MSPPSWPWLLRSGPLIQSLYGFLLALIFVGLVMVWSIDEATVQNFVDGWRSKNDYASISSFSHLPPQNQALTGRAQPHPNFTFLSTDWISIDFDPDFTSKLLKNWLSPVGEPCKYFKTEQILVPGLDGHDVIELTSGDIHEFGFTALGPAGKRRCSGGDYFEADLSSESWKSRPVLKDFGNGSYSIIFQVHPNFAGVFNLTVILLFRHFEGLKMYPSPLSFDRQLRNIQIRFYRTGSKLLPNLNQCRSISDFSRNVWVGRWTRHMKNDSCTIDNDGRYRCLPRDLQCAVPWCIGSLGLLESNGWVYSAHCSFRVFTAAPSWSCLKDRWIFFWGDSNHVDTIRNMLNFVLDLSEIQSVPRRFDINFTNPRNPSETVRITSIFNGHSNDTMNFEGLDSLKHKSYRDLIWSYFQENTVPDTIIMNSGLHDGIHWMSVRAFSKGAAYAASFWAEIIESIRKRGLTPPKIFYRTTVATGGYARKLAYNPSKMEAFNGVVLDKFRQAGLIAGVIDNFDMTFPWHFDNRCNDGVHYGRAPAKLPWKDGQIGHQYFVDLMLVHILLNVLCLK